MAETVADDWNINGSVLSIDGTTPFTQGKVKIVDFYDGAEYYLGECGLNGSGNFSVSFNKYQFQRGNSERLAPSAILRVYDYQDRVLYQSDVFVPPSANYTLHVVVTRMPVPDTWHVRGTAFEENGTTPFTQGKIIAHCVQTGQEYYLGESGFDGSGKFLITFSRSQFQMGDAEKVAPDAVFKIYDYSNNLLWQSGVITLSDSEYTINPKIGGTVVPVVPENWKVSGIVRDSDSEGIASIRVVAYDVLYGAESILGEAVSDDSGFYEIDYVKSAFQKGDENREAPNLLIKAFSLPGIPLGDSGVITHAANVAVVDVTIAPDNWRVFGSVMDADGFAVTLGSVEVYDVQKAYNTFLGSVDIDSQGKYCIDYEKKDFQKGNPLQTSPNIQVRIFYPEKVLLIQSDVVENANSNLELNLTLPAFAGDSEYCVYGSVTNNAGLPVAHHLVEAFLLRISKENKFSEVSLGSITTNVKGNYEIGYDPALLEFPILTDPLDHGPETDSIFIRLPKKPGSSSSGTGDYDTSPVVCHSAKRQKIDIQVDRASGSNDSEYDEVRSALLAYITAMQNIYDLREPAFSSRIQYIFCKTGVEEFKVLCFYHSLHAVYRINKALTDAGIKFTLNTKCDFEKFMYASFRAEISTDLTDYFAMDASAYYKVLTDGIKAHIIAETCTANLPAFWDQWLELVRLFGTAVDVSKDAPPTVSAFAATILDIFRGPKPSSSDEEKLKAWEEQKEKDDKVIQESVRIYQDVQENMDEFWEEMWKNAGAEEDPSRLFTDAFVTQLAFIFDIYSISDGFVPFAQGTFQYFATYKKDSYEPPITAYHIQNLASIDEYEWIDMTRSITNYTDGKYPDTLIGSTPNEKVNILAATTQKLFKEKFAVEVTAETYAHSENEDLKSVGEFLSVAEDFNLDSTNIDDYLAKHPDLTVNADYLKAVQRINRLTEKPESQEYLLENGFNSSYVISLVEEEVFVADHAEGLGGIDEARQIHRLAVMYATDTLSLLGKFHNSLNFEGDSLSAVNRGLSTQTFSRSVTVSNASSATSSGKEPAPTYETLFGTLSQTQFENSQTVFSASAYFVDLLEFMDSISRKDIFSRRPELKETDLTTKNAETVLPYIDLVLEMLENAISPRQLFLQDSDGKIAEFLDSPDISEMPEKLKNELNYRGIEVPETSEVVKSEVNSSDWYLLTESWRVLFSKKMDDSFLLTAYPQTSKEASDLSVVPEHRNPLTYEALSKLYFPLQLPLNPGAEEVRETLSLLGVSKHDSITALHREWYLRYKDASTEVDGELECANFGITKGMRSVLKWAEENPVFSNPWELWGLLKGGNKISQADHPEDLVPGDTWIEIMSFVPEFMRRTELDIDGMLDLFAVKILNTNNHITLKAQTKEGEQVGDPDDYMIANLTELDLNNIYRLIRLHSILECSWKDLDNFLLSAYGKMPDSLNRLHVAKLFKERYSVGWAEAACFWGPIVATSNNRQGKSPFEEIFLAKRLNDSAIDSLKVLLNSDPDTTSLGMIDSEVELALQQVLRLSEIDLNVILNWEFGKGSRYLNLNNVTKIFRVSLLASILKLSITDFYSLKSFSEVNPFDEENPDKLLLFADEVARLLDRGVKLKEVWNLLGVAPSAEKDAEWVKNLVNSLRQIVADSENFLASDAVPVFESPEELKNFKERYRKEQTLALVQTLIAQTFAEFTSGDTTLSSLLLSQQKIDDKNMFDLWCGLSQVGWTRTIGTGVKTVENFLLEDDIEITSGTEVTWSAVFIAAKDGEIKFELKAGGCLAEVKINDKAITFPPPSNPPSPLTFTVKGLAIGEAVRIDVKASEFVIPSEYYLELLWDASTMEKLDGSSVDVLVKIPVSALIPSNYWTNYNDLEGSLPMFRKMSEYLEVTGISPSIFSVLQEKSAKNVEWKIILPEELPLSLPNAADWQKFIRLLDILKLDTNFPIDESKLLLENESDSAFLKMVEALESEENATEAEVLENLCAIQNGWNPVRLKELAEQSTPKIDFTASPSQVASPDMLLYILENMPTIQKIGVSLDFLTKVQNSEPIYTDVLDFRGALQIRLGMDSWNKMVTDMMNTLRIRMRDALVDFMTYQGPCLDNNADPNSSYVEYLVKVLDNAGVMSFDTTISLNKRIHNALILYSKSTGMPLISKGPEKWEVTPKQWAFLDGRKGYRNENDLYAHFLIDVEMNTDMISSRIVQASAAIQLYVQRSLMGLERSSYLNEQEIEQWTWLKNYRLWESNRKVFLYPENWTEPELRDDKSPFFKELEAEFENGEITSETAKIAISNYLNKMRAVSGLDIIGVYRGNPEVQRAKDTLHIIGRTKSNPYQYFYRRCHRKSNFASIWTPWEIIEADIQSESVLPVFFNGQLHIFWATYKPAKYSKPPGEIAYLDDNGNKTILPVPQDTMVVEFSLCWTSLADGKWMAKKQGSSFVDIKTDYNSDDPNWKAADHYHFIEFTNTAEYLQIGVYKTYGENNTLFQIGIYTVWHDGLSRFEEVEDTIGRNYANDPKGSILLQNYTTSFDSDLVARLNEDRYLLLLRKTASGYKMITANSGLLVGADEPGFLMEDSRTFLVQRADNGKTNWAYKMESVSHPIVKEFQKRFSEGGLPGLMRRETQALSMAEGSYYSYSYYSYNYYYSVLLGYYSSGDWQAWDAGQNAFELRYRPSWANLSRPYPMDVVDFNYGSSNGIYNWELFFHAPFLIAKQLSACGRYDEAIDWFHLIFDPRNKLSGYEKTKRWALKLPAGARFWNFLPFFANPDADKTIASQIGQPDSRGSMPDTEAMKSLVDDWKNDPFNPHLIARSRIVAYQKAVLMHYLDTMVAWADQKFRIDTLESINEAIQLYILAAEILGSRPQSIPSTLKVPTLSYTQMKKKNMDSFSNVVVDLENSLVKAESNTKNTSQGSVTSSSKQVLGLGPKMFFFMVPRNEKVMAYWDLLDDRLFKIRNGMNIDGVKRQLSLFAPPIDPGLLVRAAAAGIDIGAALSDMFAPVPQYRFTFMVQKAIDLCNIVQSMGGAILSALEKKDAEEISRLRAEHEGVLLKLSREIKEMQIDEAGIAIEGLNKSKASIEFRKKHYEELIAAGDIELETQQLKQMEQAAEYSEKANDCRLVVQAIAAVPSINIGIAGFGGSPTFSTTVSPLETAKIIASVKAATFDLKAANRQNSASRSGIRAGYERRAQDWEFQKSSAEMELENIEQQILGAEIRLQVAQTELSNLEKQISQSEEVYEFLKNKYTNKELYQWMITEIASLYNKNYQLAYDVAKRAEKSYGFELGITDSSFIKFGYWDGLRKGLLAGERLMLDLRRMEISYVEKNKRELEITKPISIAQLKPQAILDLQEEGKCDFTIPEALFDMDFPGHYFRRIRSVRLTIPCVAGPYTSVSARLQLKKNSMRKSSQVNPTKGSDYPRKENDDARFTDQCIGIQGIATSQPNEATGMFDFNFRDERYLPFEGAGVISEWSLELPKELRQFDYRSITDVILTVSYTARDDGSLKNAAELWIKDNIAEYIEDLSNGGSANRLFSMKREFPDAYQNLLDSGSAKFSITAEHFPYFLKGHTLVPAEGKANEIMVLTKGKTLSNLGVKGTIKDLESDDSEEYNENLHQEGDKLYSTSIPWTESVLVEYTIEASFNASEVDDVLFNLNYEIE